MSKADWAIRYKYKEPRTTASRSANKSITDTQCGRTKPRYAFEWITVNSVLSSQTIYSSVYLLCSFPYYSPPSEEYIWDLYCRRDLKRFVCCSVSCWCVCLIILQYKTKASYDLISMTALSDYIEFHSESAPTFGQKKQIAGKVFAYQTTVCSCWELETMALSSALEQCDSTGLK